MFVYNKRTHKEPATKRRGSLNSSFQQETAKFIRRFPADDFESGTVLDLDWEIYHNNLAGKSLVKER